MSVFSAASYAVVESQCQEEEKTGAGQRDSPGHVDDKNSIVQPYLGYGAEKTRLASNKMPTLQW